MMKILLIAVMLFFTCQAVVQAYDTQVSGYYRQNGTYVQPYHRTAPNNNVYDNYSTKGNINPYTGQQGYVNPNNYQQNNNYSNTYGNNYNNSSPSNNNYYGY